MTTVHLTFTTRLYDLLRMESNYPTECPIAWEAMRAAPRRTRGRGRVLDVNVPVEDAWHLAEYLESRARVRSAWDGERYAERRDGTYPGVEGRWSAMIARQVERQRVGE